MPAPGCRHSIVKDCRRRAGCAGAAPIWLCRYSTVPVELRGLWYAAGGSSAKQNLLDTTLMHQWVRLCATNIARC